MVYPQIRETEVSGNISCAASATRHKVPVRNISLIGVSAMSKRTRFFAWAVAVVVMGSSMPISAVQNSGASQLSPAVARSVVDQYCVGCHNDRVKTAGVSLSATDIGSVERDPELWERVIRKLRARYMPPVGRPRPDESTYDALLAYLQSALDRAASARPNPGRTDAFHRLNRTEYHNAIRDLLALDVDVSALLPKDEASFGFDNVSMGGISATLLERYISAAQKISRLAVGSPVRSPATAVFVLPADLTQEEHTEGLPFGTRGGTVVRHNFPRDGEYEIQLRLTRDRNESIEGLSEPHDVEVTLDGVQLQKFTIKPQTRGEGPNPDQIVNFQDRADAGLRLRVPIKAGPHEIGAGFVSGGSVLLETERQPYQAHFNMDRHPRPHPALYSMSVVGPFDQSGSESTPSRQRIFICRPAKASEEDACAQKILLSIAGRAFRRPVTVADVQSAFRFYKEAKAESGFETGIEIALRSLLVNPEFLFRMERDPAGTAANTVYRISDIELASRLSFFLWSSIPDDELLSLAAQGKLRDLKVLEQQVQRMLRDSRSAALVDSFAEQWLYLRNLAAIYPDARLFPDFDDNLRQALRRETELLFASILKEDRNVLDLLTANYTFLNERLAKHYGIPNVYGSRFRRVSLDSSSVRGGLLGQGSILTITSYGNRTSPVLRGKWVLENILGAAPPPPPANVPPLKETGEGEKAASMRERMAQHRANPACSGCHQLMDPIGFSTENFDAIGRWRTVEAGTPIDAAGSLPDGTKFEGMAGLRRALLSRPELFVSTFTEKMLTYALGRGLEHYDSPAIRSIVQSSSADNYRFSSIVLGIVKSTPFTMRRSQ
jgi:mono/diheme cytochrome c family protein